MDLGLAYCMVLKCKLHFDGIVTQNDLGIETEAIFAVSFAWNSQHHRKPATLIDSPSKINGYCDCSIS